MYFKFMWFLSILPSHCGHTWGWKGKKKIWAVIKSSVSKPRVWAQVHQRTNYEQAEAEGVHGGDPLATGEARSQTSFLKGTEVSFMVAYVDFWNVYQQPIIQYEIKHCFGVSQ